MTQEMVSDLSLILPSLLLTVLLAAFVMTDTYIGSVVNSGPFIGRMEPNQKCYNYVKFLSSVKLRLSSGYYCQPSQQLRIYRCQTQTASAEQKKTAQRIRRNPQ